MIEMVQGFGLQDSTYPGVGWGQSVEQLTQPKALE